jgi:SAM-dependent methyltransferase
MEKVIKCIVCASDKHSEYLKCVDYLVTQEEFILSKCDNCGFVYTSPRPSINEIGPYYKSEEYYSHSSENKSIVSIVYNQIRNFNIKRKLSLIKSKTLKTGNLLDYGCGAGLFIKKAKEEGWSVNGIEPNPEAREVARKLGLDVQDPASLSSLKKSSFDVISLWHVLEHLHDIETVIPKLKSLLNENGYLVVAVPNLDSWDAKKYQQKWAAYDVPRHLYHFSPKDIKGLFGNFGMRVVSTHPMKFDSFYVSMLSENKSLMAYLRAFINGFKSNISARSSGNYSSLIYIIQ